VEEELEELRKNGSLAAHARVGCRVTQRVRRPDQLFAAAALFTDLRMRTMPFFAPGIAPVT
jgi:hypothetical protein